MLIVPDISGKTATSIPDVLGTKVYKVFGLGNPVLDLVTTDGSVYVKYELPKDGVMTPGEVQMPIFEELLHSENAMRLSGGCCQNTLRGIQYMIPPNSTFFTGSVGKDEFATILEQENKKAGLRSHFYVDEKQDTTLCAIVVHQANRSMCFKTGASGQFEHKHLEDEILSKELDEADIFYMESFFFSASFEAYKSIAEKANKSNKWVVLNICAPFLVETMKDKFEELLPFVDVVICNEIEAQAVSKQFSFDSTDLTQIASKISELPKRNTARKRVSLITNGAQPTVFAVNGHVQLIKPIVIGEEDIKDATGAGDAFAAGYLAGLALGNPQLVCIDMGHWLARECLMCNGAKYPEPKKTYPLHENDVKSSKTLVI